jgi:SMI1 / KNR4 family (SUKH-1)
VGRVCVALCKPAPPPQAGHQKRPPGPHPSSSRNSLDARRDGTRIVRGSLITKRWLPVAEDGCGDYYLVDLTSPDQGDYPVFFWDHESGYDLETAGMTKGYGCLQRLDLLAAVPAAGITV